MHTFYEVVFRTPKSSLFQKIIFEDYSSLMSFISNFVHAGLDRYILESVYSWSCDQEGYENFIEEFNS